MKRQLILGLSLVLPALLGGCGPTTEEKVQNLFQSASDWEDEDNYDAAIKDYSEAIKLKPDYHWAWINRGLVYHKKGDYDAAIKDHSEAIKLEPENYKAWALRGYAYEEIGNTVKAQADLKKAKELGFNP